MIKSVRLSDGYDLHIIPRDLLLVDGPFGIYMRQEEVDRVSGHLSQFGVYSVHCPGPVLNADDVYSKTCYPIPCDKRGHLPSLQFELMSAKELQSKALDDSLTIKFNQYIINFVSFSIFICVLYALTLS